LFMFSFARKIDSKPKKRSVATEFVLPSIPLDATEMDVSPSRRCHFLYRQFAPTYLPLIE
jgi:hypothetical protein